MISFNYYDVFHTYSYSDCEGSFNVTLLVSLLYRDIKAPLSQIRVSLVASLGAGQIIFLAGIGATDNKVRNGLIIWRKPRREGRGKRNTGFILMKVMRLRKRWIEEARPFFLFFVCFLVLFCFLLFFYIYIYITTRVLWQGETRGQEN